MGHGGPDQFAELCPQISSHVIRAQGAGAHQLACSRSTSSSRWGSIRVAVPVEQHRSFLIENGLVSTNLSLANQAPDRLL